MVDFIHLGAVLVGFDHGMKGCKTVFTYLEHAAVLEYWKMRSHCCCP